MRRTTLMVDRSVLEEAAQALGVRSYSAAVNAALSEVVRRKKVEKLADFMGTGLWQGLAGGTPLRARKRVRAVSRKG